MTQKSNISRIDRIIEAVGKVIDGDFSFHLETSDSNDEIDTLSGLINQLSANVKDPLAGHKKLSSALSDSEEKYRRLEANIPGMVYLFAMHPDATFSFPYVNEASQKLFGIAPEDLMRDATLLTSLIHPGDREKFDMSVKQSVQTLQPWREILRHIVHGDVRWYDCISRPELQPNGDILWDGIIFEVTDRITSEKSLRKSQKELSDIIAASPVGIAIYDGNGQCISTNDSFAHIIGATKQQVLEQNYRNIESWEKTGLLDMARTAVSTQSAKRHEVMTISSFKKEVFLDCHLVPFDEEGLLFMAQDITERKQVEEALLESERKYRNLYHYAHVGLFETSLVDAKIIACNQRYCDLAGFPTVDSAIGKDILHLYAHPSDREEVKEILRRQGYITDYVLQLKNRLTGALFWAEFSARTNPSRDIAEGTLIDITERKQVEKEKLSLQERLNRAEKMESLGILAGGVAHDLNNVLGIVLGYAEMLLLEKNKSSTIRPQLEAIMKGGQKAAAIVDDLLTLARRGVSGRTVLNLNKIVADCLLSPEFMKLSFHHPSVKIKTDLAPNLQNISGSSVHLGKSIYNLVSNANEAIMKGGIVTIKTRNQYMDQPIHGYDKISQGDYVVLSVSDEGEGIHATDMKRIFEPFYTKKVMGRSGTGLGLAVVWGTVKDHDGYINIQSEEGKGSTFSLYFPITREELPADDIAVAISEYIGKGESILIVDDVKEQRDIATMILEELNYLVSSVKSGEEAVEYLQVHKVDLIVLDMIMDPGMDGLDTYRKVLEIYPQQKAIVVSGFSESDRVKDVQSLGVGIYVKKPYTIEKLGMAVREEIDRAT